MLAAAGFACVAALPLFWLMHHPDPRLVFLGQLGFVVCIGLYLGAQPALMTQLAPPEVRCTAVALGYNITLGVVGGISPMVATWLVHRTNDALSPALLIAVGAAISFLAIARRREKEQAIAQLA